VLNTRYNEKRVTLLTTNFLDSDAAPSGSVANPTPLRVAGMRSPTIEDSLTDRVGKRIRSRLYEMCRTVEIVAFDYRKEIRHAGPSR
jgi:DNA replication protein DnaC